MARTERERRRNRRAVAASVLVAALAATGLTSATATAAGAGAPLPPVDPGALEQSIAGLPNAGVTGALLDVAGAGGAWSGASGVADVASGRAASPDDRFRIGSVTKVFTATVVLQLVAEHRVDLNGAIQRYLPGVLPADIPPITVAELLNHTSGLPGTDVGDGEGDAATFVADRFGHPTPAQIVAGIDGKPMSFAPGTAQQYNGVNYFLLGMLIDKITGLINIGAGRTGAETAGAGSTEQRSAGVENEGAGSAGAGNAGAGSAGAGNVGAESAGAGNVGARSAGAESAETGDVGEAGPRGAGAGKVGVGGAGPRGAGPGDVGVGDVGVGGGREAGAGVAGGVGEGYVGAVERWVIRPLGLWDTEVPAATEYGIAGGHLHGYLTVGQGGAAHLVDVAEQSPYPWAEGGMISSARDLSTLVTALLSGRLLPPAEVADLTTVPDVPYIGTNFCRLGDPGRACFGMGLMRATLDGVTVWGKTGSRPGYTDGVFATRDLQRVLVYAFTPTDENAPYTSFILGIAKAAL